MIRFISNVLALVFRHRDIIIDDELYLRRIFLTPRSWRLRVFLHFIFRGDEGRWLHDHPWDFWSLILWRGYREFYRKMRWDETRERWHRFGSWIKYSAHHSHRVEVVGGPAVTLCFVKRARRKWGFLVDDSRWVYWRDHLGIPVDVQDNLEDRIGRESA